MFFKDFLRNRRFEYSALDYDVCFVQSRLCNPILTKNHQWGSLHDVSGKRSQVILDKIALFVITGFSPNIYDRTEL